MPLCVHGVQVDNLYSPGMLASDGETEGDVTLISDDTYITQNTAVAARTAAGCCAVARGLSGWDIHLYTCAMRTP